MWASVFIIAVGVALADGHGRVLDPPGRGGLWRAGYNTPPDYDDDGLNCGGFYRQHSVNNGRCGLCGDPYDASSPKPHERGGIFDSGIITATYEAGSVITATVQITAYHLGYWEFKICPDPDSTSQDCYDAYPLELEGGGTKYYPQGSNSYNVNYRLPRGLTCEHCVLQWRYTAGNNWGVCKNGTQGLGCGNQETFGACSDISIVGDSEYIPVNTLRLPKLGDLGLLRVFWSGALIPYNWVSAKFNEDAAPAPTTNQQETKLIKKSPRKKKHKGKKKFKPYKNKLFHQYWR